MSMRVVLIQGGDVGWDQVPAMRRVVEASGVSIDWEEHVAGGAALEKGQRPLSEELLDAVRRTGRALKTALPRREATAVNYNVQLRRELGLFAAVRPLRSLAGLSARFQNVDILVIRELTEDLYAAIEHEIVPGVVQSLKVVSTAACRRFLRFAFTWAERRGRKTVTAVHKANILKLADGVFVEAFREIAREFPALATREIIVDNCCMQMATRPQQFDVMVMGNLYGDLVSALGAGVVGGIEATAGINVGGDGDGVPAIRIYESFHREAREAVTPGYASPLPLLLPAIELLTEEGEPQAAHGIRAAVERVLAERQACTPDLGGLATTSQMTDAIIRALNTP